jgi:hypothetical protein
MAESPPVPAPDERAAVLEIVRGFFTDLALAPEDVLGGPLLEWTELRERRVDPERLERKRSFVGAEIVELDACRAVVEVRASEIVRVRRAPREVEVGFDGPAVLEKGERGWRITDFTADGRRRLESILCAPLAVQEQSGVTVTVVGADRGSSATIVAVRVDNRAPVELVVGRAFFRTRVFWAPMRVDGPIAIAPGESDLLLLRTGHALDLAEPALGVSLELRPPARRLPFVLEVPLAGQPAALRRAPRRLPLLRSTWPRWLAFLAALVATMAWAFGWPALVVALFLLLGLYRRRRASGPLPAGLHQVRYGVDALVVTGAVAALRLSPEASLAIPAAIGFAVYLLLRPLADRRETARVLVALAAAVAFLYLAANGAGG